MANLTAANQARAEKALNKLYRFDGVVMPLRQYIDQKLVEGATFEVNEVPKYEYNRRKFNAMNWDEQREYQKKLEQTKTEYGLRHSEGKYLLPIPKVVFEYYASR